MGTHKDEFDTVTERLNEAIIILSVALQVEQGKLLSEMNERQKQDEENRREDAKELQRMLLEVVVNVAKLMDNLNKPSVTNEERRLIKREELDFDEVPLKSVSSNFEVYRGRYKGFPVAIKRFINHKGASGKSGETRKSFQEIRAEFDKEVKTLGDFESPNVLRMFGICVENEKGSNPEYLIVMEYCEKGSLRDVLDSGCELSWPRKARMCLDIAQGLYRLHQAEDKPKVHGCITSSRFFVDEAYRVKLGGFELAQTMTSLRVGRNLNEVRSQPYKSPELLRSIDAHYTKECEVYSIGIVMWEIATRLRPFTDPETKAGWSDKVIKQKVYKEKYIEPLPDACPKSLRDVIDRCRAFDHFRRPSAGVLVDKLRSVVTQLEEI